MQVPFVMNIRLVGENIFLRLWHCSGTTSLKTETDNYPVFWQRSDR